MIIGIDASRANKKERTGTEWYSYHLIKNLAQIDLKNEYVLYFKEKPRDDLSGLPPNFHPLVLSWPPRYLWSQMRLSARMLHKKPDVLFVPAHTIPLVHPGNTVTACHDIGFERLPALYSKKELRYHRFSMRLAVKSAARLITVSEFSKNEILGYYQYPEERITAIGDREREECKKILQKYQLLSEHSQGGGYLPFIFYTGRLEAKKNIVSLIKAFKILKSSRQYHIPHRLVLAGTPGYGYERIEEELKNLGYFQREVIQTGWLPSEELCALYNFASCFVLPSFYEGFGIPILEAFACGVPVAASWAASIPEVAGEAALLSDPNDPEDLAYKIYIAISNQTIREECVKRGFQRLPRFSWRICAQKTLEVISQDI